MKKIKSIGIYAHVDAGKTTLTEQLLYNVGAIKKAGRVDNGDTQTDSNSIEKERGISIYTMPTSYNYKDQTINIIDTPGHVDFVAEVQRSMLVLDGAILVISAKEGVQSHTKLLFRTLHKMNVPTLIFINKIDRMGVNIDAVISQIKNQLTENIYITQNVIKEGTQQANVENLPMFADDNIVEMLSLSDEELLNDYVEGINIDKIRLSSCIKEAVKECEIHPVMFGSALKNIGIDKILNNINEFFPLFTPNNSNDISGTVFKIFYLNNIIRATTIKLISGKINMYDYIGDDKITSITSWNHGRLQSVKSLNAGEIGYIVGANHLNIGDCFGDLQLKGYINLGKPTLKVKISPATTLMRVALLKALTKIADCDQYLSYELNEFTDDIYINMFGYVQMEIVEEILKRDYNIDIKFDKPMTIYMETPKNQAEAFAYLNDNLPFDAGIGLRIRPLPLGSGVIYKTDVNTGGLTKPFHKAIKDGVYSYVDQGLFGWEITNMEVSLIDYEFNSVDSTPSDFRKLTPLVMFRALKEAKTKLLWPTHTYVLNIPTKLMGRAINDLGKMKALINTPIINGDICTINGIVPSDNINNYQLDVHEYTSGVGFFESQLAGYEDVAEGVVNKREKFKPDAANEKEYLMSILNVFR